MTKDASKAHDWRQDLNYEFPEPAQRYPRYTAPFRRSRRKDFWTKTFKANWQPLADWKLPRKIKQVRSHNTNFRSLLQAPLGGDWVTAKLVQVELQEVVMERRWRIKRDWDRTIYGRSVHDAFKGWDRYILPGPDGKNFVAYEGEFFRLLGGRYTTQVSNEEITDAVIQLIKMRFSLQYVPMATKAPKRDHEDHLKVDPEETQAQPTRRLRQTGQSRRTQKNKLARLMSLAAADYVDNGGNLTLSLPPDPTLNPKEREEQWHQQRKAWCKKLDRIARRYGVQIDWFLEISRRWCPAAGTTVENAHYHLLYRRKIRDRATFPEVRDAFLAEVRALATRIWPINNHGLFDQPIRCEDHIEHLKQEYFSKSANCASEIVWGRYYGRMNANPPVLKAMLTKRQHFQLRRIQARANNHHLPTIKVDICGRMTGDSLLKALDALGVEYWVEGEEPSLLVIKDLVTVVSPARPDTMCHLTQGSPDLSPLHVYMEKEIPKGQQEMRQLEEPQNLKSCGYRIISSDQVNPPSGGPLFRNYDGVPDISRIDIGAAFAIDAKRASELVKSTHSLTPPLEEADYLALMESIRRSGRVLLPVFLDQHGKVLLGAESIKAVAEIQQGAEEIEVEPLPVVYLHVEDAAAEAELILALNIGRSQGYSQSERNKARRTAVTALLMAGHDGTDRHVASLCGLSDSTVVKAIRLDLEAQGAIERRLDFTDRRGHVQRRASDYSLKVSTGVADLVSAPNTSGANTSVLGDEALDAPTPLAVAKSPDSSEAPLAAFFSRWREQFGERPVWPEEVEPLAAEFKVAVPTSSGVLAGYRLMVYHKPDGSDRVLTLA